MGGTNNHTVNQKLYMNSMSNCTTPQKNYNAIADSGSTCHYFMTNNTCTNVVVDTCPTTVKLPDGTNITLTHTAELPISTLSKQAKTVKIFKELKLHH